MDIPTSYTYYELVATHVREDSTGKRETLDVFLAGDMSYECVGYHRFRCEVFVQGQAAMAESDPQIIRFKPATASLPHASDLFAEYDRRIEEMQPEIEAKVRTQVFRQQQAAMQTQAQANGLRLS